MKYILDHATVGFSGAGGGLAKPTQVILALEKRYVETQEPKNISLWYSTGPGDRADRGLSPLAKQVLFQKFMQATGDNLPDWQKWPKEMKLKDTIFLMA